jgi:poly-gamma-glutamate synthesis protein (capsule biosynthesis protein)
LIADDVDTSTTTPVLFNHSATLNCFKNFKSVIFGLANNHVLDIPQYFNDTIRQLRSNGYHFTGASQRSSRNDEVEFIELNIDNRTVTVFNSCWNFLLYHVENPSQEIYVNELDELNLIEAIKKYHEQNPKNHIVVFLHWSFDLEVLPFPMYRKFSQTLIDNGVEIVVGCHSHCVQGGERYKDGIIVYGLGNFYIPNGEFANKKLKFPEFSRTELALEYDFETKESLCHWFQYTEENEHDLIHIATEKFETSKILASYSPYAGMADLDYLKYYKKNRRKKLLTPVFRHHNEIIRNRIYMKYLKLRGAFARYLAKIGVIGWQN